VVGRIAGVVLAAGILAVLAPGDDFTCTIAVLAGLVLVSWRRRERGCVASGHGFQQ
jgi:uncharacterized membrane protein YjjP (DUF1212 family)